MPRDHLSKSLESGVGRFEAEAGEPLIDEGDWLAARLEAGVGEKQIKAHLKYLQGQFWLAGQLERREQERLKREQILSEGFSRFSHRRRRKKALDDQDYGL